MGLNSGEVVVGAIGDDLRMDYTALGHTVGLAARMEQLAEPGQALLTEHTAQLVAGLLRAARPRRRAGQGRQRAAAHLCARGPGPPATRASTPPAPAACRASSAASPSWRCSRRRSPRRPQGRGQIVAVVGEPGVGKSRLCYEFVARCRARGVHVYEAHGLPHGKAIPLLPWLELLRSAFGLSEDEGIEATRDKIAGRMLRLDPGLEDAVPLMFDFLGVSDPARPAPRDGSRRAASASWRASCAGSWRVAARAARWPCSCWRTCSGSTPPASRSSARSSAATAHTRTLVVANFRPEYRAEQLARSASRSIELQPLGDAAADELLRELLGDDPALAELAALIRAQSGGNPFFIEEAVQALRNEGVLAPARDGSARRFTPHPPDHRGPDPRHRAGAAGRPHRPPAGGHQGGAADRRGDRQALQRRAAASGSSARSASWTADASVGAGCSPI